MADRLFNMDIILLKDGECHMPKWNTTWMLDARNAPEYGAPIIWNREDYITGATPSTISCPYHERTAGEFVVRKRGCQLFVVKKVTYLMAAYKDGP
jgi:hypothetical protein